MLNGVNLDMLGHRDPAVYGGISLNELETQIYEWARELRLSVRCRQTNSEGEYIDWIHDAYGDADALIVNPGAWSHYSYAIHDALESSGCRSSRCTSRTSTSARTGGGISVIADLVAHRVIGKGPDGYREALAYLAGSVRRMTARLDALRARLEEPLLVTNLVNILYLTGFDTSNAALLVDPGGPAKLFTDFRYIEAAEEVPGVEAVLAKRSLMRDLAERLKGQVAFEADVLPFSQVEVLASGGLELVPTTGIVEALRAVKDEDEIDAIRRAARAADRAFEALTAETWIGRSEREIAWRLRQLLHAHGVDQLSFDTAIACGPNGAKPHGGPTDPIVETGTLVIADWGARLDGYCSDCTRTLATGDVPTELRASTTSASRRSSPRSTGSGPG